MTEEQAGLLKKENNELRVARDNAIADYRRLKSIHNDVSTQLDELRSGRTLTPHELSEITELRRSFNAINEEQNKLALWLRDNKSKEIARGKHNGMSLSDVCIMYMAKKWWRM